MLWITRKLLKIEESARKFFESVPFFQAFVAGAGAIIFWRGIWELLDKAGISPLWSIILGTLLLGSVGVFIQTFLGNTIIIKNVEHDEREERKVLRKVEGEVATGEITLAKLAAKIDALAEIVSKK